MVKEINTGSRSTQRLITRRELLPLDLQQSREKRGVSRVKAGCRPGNGAAPALQHLWLHARRIQPLLRPRSEDSSKVSPLTCTCPIATSQRSNSTSQAAQVTQFILASSQRREKGLRRDLSRGAKSVSCKNH